jgi:hypothetical protein
MGSHVRKSRRKQHHKEHRSNWQEEPIKDDAYEILENISLKYVSLEERRKEAEKPLFLKRYE